MSRPNHNGSVHTVVSYCERDLEKKKKERKKEIIADSAVSSGKEYDESFLYFLKLYIGLIKLALIVRSIFPPLEHLSLEEKEEEKEILR